MKKIDTGIAACAAVLLFALAANAQTPLPPPAGTVVLTARFPHTVTLNKPPPADGEVATIRLTLTNTSAASVTLQKANECMTHVWTVMDSSGQQIDDRAMCPMIFMPVTQTIAAHGRFVATQGVPLDVSKYQDGGKYTLHYTFWSVATDLKFTVHIAQ